MVAQHDGLLARRYAWMPGAELVARSVRLPAVRPVHAVAPVETGTRGMCVISARRPG